MASNQFQLLTQSSGQRAFTDDELSQMPKKLLSVIATYNGAATRIPDEYATYFRGRIVQEDDTIEAMRLISRAMVRSTSHFRPEGFMNTNGGEYHYYPLKVERRRPDGTTQERANAVIPAPFDTAEVYPHAQALAAAICQVVTVKNGSWICCVNKAAWTKTLIDESGMDAPSMIQFANDSARLLNADSNWAMFDLPTKNSHTGLEALVFVRSAVDRMNRDTYDLFNSRMVFKMIKPFEFVRSENQWYERVNDKGELLVPASSFEIIDDSSKAVKDILVREKIPEVAHYCGGYAPSFISFPVSLGTMKSAKDCHGRMMELAGSKDSSTVVLHGMKGFSALTDDFGKRMQYTMASVLAAWERGKAVNISLYSVGDLPMLVSSVNKWKTYLKEGGCAGIPASVPDVKYILPNVLDAGKVSPAYHSAIIDGPDDDAVVIGYHDTSLPTSDQKGRQVDYEKAALQIVPQQWQDKDLDIIMWGPVYGSCFFPEKKIPSVVNQTLQDPPSEFYDRVSIYEFGAAAGFRGIITTLKDFNLWGFGYPQTDTGYDMRSEKLHPIMLRQFKTKEAWFRNVESDCAKQAMAWLRPTSRYSPISNLPFISRKGVAVVRQMVSPDGGNIIGNLAHLPQKVARRGKPIGRSLQVVTAQPVTSTTTNVRATTVTSTVTRPAPAVTRIARRPDPNSSSSALPLAPEHKTVISRVPLKREKFEQVPEHQPEVELNLLEESAEETDSDSTDGDGDVPTSIDQM